MARNKYPEQTVNRILDVSLRLFLEKGYERTSIQDITDGLEGLTKGAIYHHFRSKEEILLAVMDRIYISQDRQWQVILNDPKLTGIQKLRSIFLASLLDPGQKEFFGTAPNLLENPRLLALQMKDIMEISSPQYIEPVIRQGVEDGTIHTKYPKQLAEVLLLLINIWLLPAVFHADAAEMEDRYGFFQELFAGTGFDLLEDRTVKERLNELYRTWSEKQ